LLHPQIHASLLHVDPMLHARWLGRVHRVLVYLTSLDLLQTADQNV
jgi:hypothetical protein